MALNVNWLLVLKRARVFQKLFIPHYTTSIQTRGGVMGDISVAHLSKDRLNTTEYCCSPCPSIYDHNITHLLMAAFSRVTFYVTKVKSSQIDPIASRSQSNGAPVGFNPMEHL